MALISTALAIASFAAPKLAKWLGGDKAEEVANEVVGIARNVTGEPDGETAMEALKASPELLVRFQSEVADLEVRLYEAETDRLRIVNDSMRAEAKADDPYVRRWRPTIGYVVAGQLLLLGIAIFVAVVGAVIAVFKGMPDVVQVLFEGLATLLTSLTVILGIELSILGVNIAQRSKDKQVAAGLDPGPGMLSAIAKRLAGGGNG